MKNIQTFSCLFLLFSMTENFMTKFTFVFLLIHDKLVNLEKKFSSKTLAKHMYMCSVLLPNLK